VGGTLFFSANDGSHGTELWALAPSSSVSPPPPPTLSPTLTSLNPSTATEDGTPFTLTVTGGNFDSTATVLWNSTALTTTFQSATQLEALVPGYLVTDDEGFITVSVTEHHGTSGGLPFTVIDDLPVLPPPPAGSPPVMPPASGSNSSSPMLTPKQEQALVDLFLIEWYMLATVFGL
jgi:hypothetical protein